MTVFFNKIIYKKKRRRTRKNFNQKFMKNFLKFIKRQQYLLIIKKLNFERKQKSKKKSNNNNIIDISDKNKSSNIFIDLQKSKRKKEKISLISKDKIPNEKRNLIFQQNNEILKELSGDFDGNDQIDISIHSSNKKPVGLTNNIFKNYKKIKYPISAYKNRGKLEKVYLKI